MKNLKKLKLTHTLVLIYIMVVLTVIGTWIFPGGKYQRTEQDGRTIPVADSFQFAEGQPQGLGARSHHSFYTQFGPEIRRKQGFMGTSHPGHHDHIFAAGAFFNPFTVGIAQGIAGLFLALGIFSGIMGRLSSEKMAMPIMAPLGDLVGITRQTAVFAFQLSEYINPILPTSGVTMGVLGLLTLIPPMLTHWGPA